MYSSYKKAVTMAAAASAMYMQQRFYRKFGAAVCSTWVYKFNICFAL